MVGKTLGHYRISGRLGKGGMGEVFRATDTRLDRQVALKTLPPDVARSPERRARFEREAKAVAALNHPNIVTIHSVEEHEGTCFFTMELVEGRTLADLIRPGGLPVSQIFDIAIPLADALAAAHKKGVTHRDLKPGNVMINDEGRVKVLDFGLAKLAEPAPSEVGEGEGGTHLPTASAAMTGEGKILGTVAYMSPEQAEGKPVDPRSDVFSLGIVLYEMATGQRPFRGDTTISTITSIMRDTPQPLGQVNPAMPRHLGRIIQRCLAKQPDRRYQAALDVRNELESLKSEIDSGELDSAYAAWPSSGPGVAQPASSTAIPPPSAPPTGSGSRGPLRDQPSMAEGSLPPTSGYGSSFPSGVGESQVTTGVAQRQPSRRNWTALAAILVVGAVLIMAAVVYLRPGWQSGTPRTAATLTGDKSIAVLPFTNMSDDKENEYFSDGLAEEMISLLSKVPSLRVAASTSSFHFKGHTGDVTQVAQQLDVATILEGSVRRADNRVRVTAQLVQAAGGFTLWSETYERQLDDIFGIQQDIATQVVDALKITLLGEDERRLAARPTDSIEAYDAYLLGHQKMRTRRSDALEKAAQDFQRAIDLDPGFALAYVALAEATSHLQGYGTLSASEMLDRAEPLIDKAMTLDDKLGEAWAMRGVLRQARMDYEGAVAAFERAIELNPNYALAYMWYGGLMGTRDLERSLELRRQALKLDPMSTLIHINIAATLKDQGKYEEALAEFRRAQELDPAFSLVYTAIADLYEGHLGRPDEALRWAERAVNTDPGNPALQIGLGNRFRNRGELDRAMAVVREVIERDPAYAGGYKAMAELQRARGRLDEGIRWYHEAYQRDIKDTETIFWTTMSYLTLSDGTSAKIWADRLRKAEEVPFLSRFVDAVILRQAGDPAKSDAIIRELAAALPRMGRAWVFFPDMEAGNYDAILQRETEEEPALLEDGSRIDHRTVEGGIRAAAALLGMGDRARARPLLRKCEEFLLGLDEAARRSRYANELGWIYAYQDRLDEALAEWRVAFKNGWRPSWTAPYPRFATFERLLEDPRFRSLLDDTQADLDRQRRALAQDGLANAEPSL